MRFHSLVLALATAIGVAACGSSNNSDTSSDGQYSSLPPIEVGDPSPVSIVDGEFLNAFATADDTVNNRWIVADHAQGIIAVDKTTDERTVIAPIAADDNNSVFTTIDDIALDVATGTLYILDIAGTQIVALDTSTGESHVALSAEDISVDDNYILRAPKSLFFDNANNRLLIGDSYGLTYPNPANPELSSLAFAVYILDPSDYSLSVMAAEANLANPLPISYEIRNFHYDAQENNLYASGFIHSTTTVSGRHLYTGLRISAETWEQVGFYEESSSVLDNSEISRRAAQHSNTYNAITYDNTNNSVFLFNQYQQALYAIDISNIDNEDPELTEVLSIPVTFPSDSKDYNLRIGSDLAWSENQLHLFSPDLRAYLAVNTDDFNAEERPDALGERELIFTGSPAYKNRLNAPQQPRHLSYSPDEQGLVVTDWAADQRDALVQTNDGYQPLTIEVDLSGITPDERSFTTTEPPGAPSTDQPKPALVAFDPNTGDTIFVGHEFYRETEDPYIWSRYYFAIYIRKSGEDTFKPISTYTDDNEVKLVDFTKTSIPFALSAVGDMVATNQTAYLAIGSSIVFWQDSENFGILDSANNAYNPTDITGIAINTASQLLVSDRFHHSIIAIDLEAEGGEDDDIREINVVSGPEQAGNFLRLPVGLAIDTVSNTGYTFENESRSIIAIDLATGERTRIESNPNYLRSVSTLTISDDGQTLYILDKTINRLMVMDIASGNQQWLDSIE